MVVSEWREPEREREAEEKVKMRENEGAGISGVSQREERGVESLSSRPHPEVAEQLKERETKTH